MKLFCWPFDGRQINLLERDTLNVFSVDRPVVALDVSLQRSDAFGIVQQLIQYLAEFYLMQE